MTPPRTSSGPRWLSAVAACFCLATLIVPLVAQTVPNSSSATGTIEGRVTNPATSTVVERARISIDGTDLETFSDPDGYYRLANVPAGTAQVRATFTGFPPATAA